MLAPGIERYAQLTCLDRRCANRSFHQVVLAIAGPPLLFLVIFPSHTDLVAVFASPDHTAGPKRAAVVKGQVEGPRQFGSGRCTKTKAGATRVQIVDHAIIGRCRPHANLGWMCHFSSCFTLPKIQHVDALADAFKFHQRCRKLLSLW